MQGGAGAGHKGERGTPLRKGGIGRELLRFGWVVEVLDGARPGDTWNPQAKPHDERVYCNAELEIGVRSDTGQNTLEESLSIATSAAPQSTGAARMSSTNDEPRPGRRRRLGHQQL